MEENKNQEGKNTITNSPKKDYYASTGKKISDFLFGFISTIIVFYSVSFARSLFAPSISNLVWINLFALFIIIATLTLLWLLFFKTNRRFIAIGIMFVLLIPILISLSSYFISF